MPPNSSAPSQSPVSRLTGGPVEKLFTARVLHKYDVIYFRCRDTGFIQTEDPYWLKEAYPTAIADLDVGYVQRNLYMAEVAAAVIARCFRPEKKFLDFGGGCGLFVRLLRDRGFDCYRTDPYSVNLFARFFEFDRTARCPEQFELVTAFEVFEHLPDPMREIAEMFRLSDSILFSTELQPAKTLAAADDWWYFSPDHGQHVAFYTQPALEFIAHRFDARLLTNGTTLHLLTRNTAIENPFSALPPYPQDPRSLIQHDLEMIRTLLQNQAADSKG